MIELLLRLLFTWFRMLTTKFHSVPQFPPNACKSRPCEVFPMVSAQCLPKLVSLCFARPNDCTKLVIFLGANRYEVLAISFCIQEVRYAFSRLAQVLQPL